MLIACLLSPSGALAGQATGTIRVGFTVLGPSNASTVVRKTAAGTADAATESSALFTRKMHGWVPPIPLPRPVDR
jgi:hypothetical protein